MKTENFKRILLAFLVMLALNISSCNPDLVDSAPLEATESSYFSNVNEFRAQLVGVYAAYYDWYHFSAPQFNFGGYVTGTMLLPGDDLTVRDGIRNEVELFDGSLNPTQDRITFFYETCYKVITRANITIEKVRTVDFSDYDGADEIARMEGEALFLRAFAYFTLFNNFGSVPLITERPVSTDDTNVPKSPANDIISQAIIDAQEAIAILPESWDAINLGRVTKNSARGLLAKALVFRANYNGDDTADMQAAINAYNSLTTVLVPNYIDNFNSFTENNAESLFEIQSARPAAINNLILHNDGPWRAVENQSVYRGYMMEPGGGGFNDASTKFFITEKLRAAYGSDPRISIFLNPGDSHDGKIFQKYNKPDGVMEFAPIHGSTVNNERLLRHSDVMLMAAEAQLKTGNAPAAINLVNSVRTRARQWALTQGVGDGNEPADYSTSETNAGTIMGWIMDERWVELAGEAKRWDDLRRWQRSGDVDISGWDGSITGFSTNLASPVQFDISKHLLFPIPQTEIDRNSEIIENNPGY